MIDFNKHLTKGKVSYDKEVGTWWTNQSENQAHLRAYDNIAQFVKSEYKGKANPVIVDFACGNGLFIKALMRQFPKATFIGLDGSIQMLNIAKRNIEAIMGKEAEIIDSTRFNSQSPHKVQLILTSLPNFSLPKAKADIVTFVFPNLSCAPKDRPYYDKHGYQNIADCKVARMLSRFRDMDPEDEVAELVPDECYDDLMTGRVISRNLHSFLKKDGLLTRVDYANAPRQDLSPLNQWRSLFAEGALEEPIKNQKAKQLFAFQKSRYFRSTVILDVYHQTGDETDKVGGFFVSGFRAV